METSNNVVRVTVLVVEYFLAVVVAVVVMSVAFVLLNCLEKQNRNHGAVKNQCPVYQAANCKSSIPGLYTAPSERQLISESQE